MKIRKTDSVWNLKYISILIWNYFTIYSIIILLIKIMKELFIQNTMKSMRGQYEKTNRRELYFRL
jgi:hypothetical protein